MRDIIVHRIGYISLLLLGIYNQCDVTLLKPEIIHLVPVYINYIIILEGSLHYISCLHCMMFILNYFANVIQLQDV